MVQIFPSLKLLKKGDQSTEELIISVTDVKIYKMLRLAKYKEKAQHCLLFVFKRLKDDVMFQKVYLSPTERKKTVNY